MSDDSQNIFRKESLERLSSPEQLDQLMQVVSPRSWLPLASLGVLVLFALLWGILGRIPITATGRGIIVYPVENSTDLLNVVYFPVSVATQIQPGMKIMIIPDSAMSQAGIPAQVQSIVPPSITTLDRARQIQETVLPSETVEVIAQFQQPVDLAAGIPITARLTLAQKTPIAFVFPFLEHDKN